MSVAYRWSTQYHDGGSTAASFTATFPAGAAAGDLLVLAVTTWNNVAVNTPSGWTAQTVNSTTGAGTYAAKVNVFTRVATSADITAGSVAVTFGAGDYFAGAMAAYTGCDPATPVTQQAATGSGSNGTALTAPSVTTTVDGGVIVECWAGVYTTNAGSAALTLPTNSRQAAASSAGWCACGISDQTQATHGATGTQAATAAKTGSWVAATLAIAPPAAAVGFTGWGIPA